MNCKIFCFLLCFSIIATCELRSPSNIDYYWKNYYNVIPNDAFVAIKKIDDQPVAFVGQAFVAELGMFPATLYRNETSVTITRGGKNKAVSSNLKILATRSPRALKWIKTTYNGIDALKQLDFLKFVAGGVENNQVLYIARHQHEGVMQIGKVYSDEGVVIPNKNGGAFAYPEFEILVYCDCH